MVIVDKTIVTNDIDFYWSLYTVSEAALYMKWGGQSVEECLQQVLTEYSDQDPIIQHCLLKDLKVLGWHYGKTYHSLVLWMGSRQTDLVKIDLEIRYED